MDDKHIDAYLDRIAVPRPDEVDEGALRDLHRAHLLAVPFENLSLHLSELVSLDEDDLFDKIVNRRRGGFCYELNGAFALLLQGLGAQVQRLAGRVYGGERLGPPFDHMALSVTLADGSGPWLADVGFGSHSVGPLLLRESGEQHDDAGTFRVVPTADGDVDVIKDGRPEYRLELKARALTDFIPTCWWQQSSPQSHFLKSTICSKLTEDGRISLSGRTLIRTVDGHRTEAELTTDEAVLAGYRDYFGVVLDRVPEVSSSS
jgi:N-hydroxyarylamine O-acetyltransferase